APRAISRVTRRTTRRGRVPSRATIRRRATPALAANMTAGAPSARRRLPNITPRRRRRPPPHLPRRVPTATAAAGGSSGIAERRAQARRPLQSARVRSPLLRPLLPRGGALLHRRPLDPRLDDESAAALARHPGAAGGKPVR